MHEIIRRSAENRPDVTIIDLSGELTLLDGVAQFSKALQEEMAQGRANIILNFRQIHSIDASVVSFMRWALTTSRSKNGDVKLLNVPRQAINILDVFKSRDDFGQFNNEQEAIASFRPALQPANISAPAAGPK